MVRSRIRCRLHEMAEEERRMTGYFKETKPLRWILRPVGLLKICRFIY